MKKLVVTLIFLVSSCCIIFAQSVSYNTLEDNPYAIKQLYIRLNPFYVEAFRTNTASLGAGIELKYLFRDKMIFHFNNWKSYSTIATNSANDKFIVRDLTAEYILFDKAEKGEVKIVLSESVSQSSKGTYSSSKYIKVPGTTRTLFSARGGIYNYQSPFKISELKKVKAHEILDTAGHPNGFGNAGFLIKSTSVFAGISYNIINNTKIKASGFGKAKSTEKWLSIYLDLMYAPLISIENYSAKNSKRLGWRYGFLADWHTTKNITFSGRAEIGSRTGIKQNGFYLYGGFGITIALLKNKNAQQP